MKSSDIKKNLAIKNLNDMHFVKKKIQKDQIKQIFKSSLYLFHLQIILQLIITKKNFSKILK